MPKEQSLNGASRRGTDVARGGANPAHGGEVVLTDFAWRHAGRKDPAVAQVNLRIAPGEKVLLLGPSGAGKSTLLAGIAGVLGDAADGEQQGHITVDGHDPAVARGAVGMVLQDPDSQVIAAKVGDDVVFGCENLGVSREDMWQRATAALHTVGLGHLPLDHPTAQLSGGQKQRLALAGVLAMRPSVIVLDEPTANLDPDGVADVRDAVIRACQELGSTLIVVEHRVATWAEHVDRAIVLGTEANIIADGHAAEILDSEAERLASAGIWVPNLPLSINRHWSPAEPAGRDGTASEKTGLISTNNLTVGWHKQPIRAGITAALRPGSTCLTGGNGSGKSTMALTLAGLLPAVSGSVDASGLRGKLPRKRRVTADPITWPSADLVRHIGYVFQDPEHQFATRTVREELLLGPKAAGMDAAAAEQRADELLDALGLTRLGPANPFTLSGGEKRRLSVAAILATKPQLLILDEPTFGQDRATFTALVGLLQELADQGTSLLSITHDADYLAALGQHHWHLPDGDGLEVVQ